MAYVVDDARRGRYPSIRDGHVLGSGPTARQFEATLIRCWGSMDDPRGHEPSCVAGKSSTLRDAGQADDVGR